MLRVRELMYCKPGKVRPMVEKFKAMAALMEKAGQGKMRVMTDFVGERYWTIVSEFEVESLDVAKHHRGESLVDLDEVDVGEIHLRPRE